MSSRCSHPHQLSGSFKSSAQHDSQHDVRGQSHTVDETLELHCHVTSCCQADDLILLQGNLLKPGF